MNLMFRKNFREGNTSKGSGVGGLKNKNANRYQAKRSRDMSMTNSDDYHFRTHIFFATPNRSEYQNNKMEETCGALTGVEVCNNSYDTHQPLVERSTTDNATMLKDFWGKRSETPMFDAARQVSYSGGKNVVTSSQSEPSFRSLAALDKDCFIIPVHSIDRFLPAGIPLPPPIDCDGKQSPLNVLEVCDPKIAILAHLMSPYEPIEPILESPLSHPIIKQRMAASELLQEIQQSNNAVGGMLLANLERTGAEFTFISIYTIDSSLTDAANFYTGVKVKSLTKFEPKITRYTAAHTLDLYSEVASICRPPLTLSQNEIGNFKKSLTPSTGYIISVYKVFEGDDGERFERNWLYWTGARMLWRYLPKSVGLRQIKLHKSLSTKGDKMYLLIVECSTLLNDLEGATALIPAVRARLLGYTGLYRPIQIF